MSSDSVDPVSCGDRSVEFFDRQFQRQIREGETALNPFEEIALPYLRGRVLDFGCGMGNLAIAAARRGCIVTALDASATAIAHLRQRAELESLAIDAQQSDLRGHRVTEEFDAIVSIGLLMFFDCATAYRCLANLQEQVRGGGVSVVNALIEGTTYLDMFSPAGHCLFPRAELERRFAGWDIVHSGQRDFPVAPDKVKSFATVIAQKPVATLNPASRGTNI